jgi:hypothetical protein
MMIDMHVGPVEIICCVCLIFLMACMAIKES